MTSPAKAELRGKRALVMGLGTRQGGAGVARYLVEQGADVTVTDLRREEDLIPALQDLAELPIAYRLGGHEARDFENADIVVRNAGVPTDSPWLQLARAAGARIEMEMTLFFRACPSPIVGVTGTKGKTTTSTLCAAILRQFRPDTVLAGNMGRTALGTLPEIGPRTPVVIELSSFQLEGLGEQRLSPHVGVLTNISPDHLNRYPSMDAYLDAKLNIARWQSPGDWFVVNRDDPPVWAHREAGRGRVVPFGTDATAEGDGALLRGDHLVWRRDGNEHEICRLDELNLGGRHNALNALAAAAAALLYGADLAHARAGLMAATPVCDRLEPIAEIDGVLYINDTTATTPAAVFAALETYHDRPVIVIAGGSEKNVDLDELASRLADRAEAIVLLEGAATPALCRLLERYGARRISGPHGSMERGVAAAAELARPGMVVLLSPGCASFGMFRDEFQRGDAFREAVRARLTGANGGIRR